MKARIKKTGEIANIADYARVTLDQCDSWGNPIELGFDEVEILQETTSDIDWEQRRYEISKSVLPCFRDGSNVWLSAEETAKCAVYYADALIAELKKGGEK